VFGTLLSAMRARQYYVTRSGRILDTGDRGKKRTTARMGTYAVAVDEVARDLSAEERRTLGETGTVPEWFLARVEQRYQSIRAEQRRQR
jgi:hypothetical protein